MLRNQLARFILLAAALTCLAAASGCSTAPKRPDAVFEVANQGAQYAKLADGFLAKGQLDQAVRLYEEARRSYSSVDDLRGVAGARSSLGRAWLAAGRLEEAESEFKAALEYAAMGGAAASATASGATAGLGELAWRRGDGTEALRLFAEAAVLAGKDEAALAVALHDTATVQAATGMLAEARDGLAKAAAINLKLKRWTELASDRFVLASLEAKAGALDAALAAALGALDADKRAENGRGAVGDLAAAARILERLGRGAEAYGYWRRSFDAALALEEAAGVRKALEALAPLAERLGKADEAKRWRALLGKLDAAEGRAAAGTVAPSSTAPASPASP